MSSDSSSPEADEKRPRGKVAALIGAAREQFEELVGIPVEGVSGVEKAEDGWTVTLEAVELLRVPDTVSLLATYTVDLDSEGDLAGYRRVRRYTRGRADAL
ncbi:gas vesicle protein GvpO [Allonocardiopsis opalescens]|uniref:Gas vesicle protein GvpO n=1 Tax=Allonocardiopsis opalescens TaxID=1144618 RepID=A0A2T0QEP4_9ACTN|nr:gas vesicle protein GvpO [Allonocardiopsis opalescens]PRY02365.1 gas vesicle protein GvpO [Allonocardiopsis opalescens]